VLGGGGRGGVGVGTPAGGNTSGSFSAEPPALKPFSTDGRPILYKSAIPDTMTETNRIAHCGTCGPIKAPPQSGCW
jgi:hypothetical protein